MERDGWVASTGEQGGGSRAGSKGYSSNTSILKRISSLEKNILFVYLLVSSVKTIAQPARYFWALHTCVVPRRLLSGPCREHAAARPSEIIQAD